MNMHYASSINCPATRYFLKLIHVWLVFVMRRAVNIFRMRRFLALFSDLQMLVVRCNAFCEVVAFRKSEMRTISNCHFSSWYLPCSHSLLKRVLPSFYRGLEC